MRGKHILLSLCAESSLSTALSSHTSELLICSGWSESPKPAATVARGSPLPRQQVLPSFPLPCHTDLLCAEVMMLHSQGDVPLPAPKGHGGRCRENKYGCCLGSWSLHCCWQLCLVLVSGPCVSSAEGNSFLRWRRRRAGRRGGPCMQSAGKGANEEAGDTIEHPAALIQFSASCQVAGPSAGLASTGWDENIWQ